MDFAAEQAHYLRHVLRRNAGDALRVFNGRDGEWLVTITHADKKTVGAKTVQQLIAQPPAPAPVHLFCAPIKKARMDILIEKAVELGATHIHPVITQNTEVRQVNDDRLRAQIIEATEQCERLDVPALAAPLSLPQIADRAGSVTVFAAIERDPDAPLLAAALAAHTGPCALLVGPEGGFTAGEKDMLRRQTGLKPVSLGPRTLRAETAALVMLAAVMDRA